MNACMHQRIFGALALTTVLLLAGTCRAADEPGPLSQDLLVALEAEGLDAAVAIYRQHRERGFVGVQESRADTTALGYRLLKRDQKEAAIRIFRLNAETHSLSPGAWASLGEAYSATGDRRSAEAAYRQALALDPHSRSARYGLARLTGRVFPPLPPMVMTHILAGVLSVFAGAGAMVAPKGRPVHRLAGKVFVGAMSIMAGSAVIRAAQNLEAEVLNLWMGTLALYLVISGWRAGRYRISIATFPDWVLSLAALTTAAGLLFLALRGGAFAGAALVFGIVALMAVAGDVRWFRRTPSDPTRRVVRHLWRVGLGMFIAVGSVFLGQPHAFPFEIRNSGLLVVPPLLVALTFVCWFLRYRFARHARPRLPLVSSPVKP